MRPLWNEKYLYRGKLLKPEFIRDWNNGLKHLVYAFKRRKAVISVCIVLAIGQAITTALKIEEAHNWFHFSEQFVLMFIACPVILSAWADLKDDEVAVFETNLSKLSIKMFLLSTLYFFGIALFALFLFLPGVWFATVFSMAMVILCVDNSGFFKCFSRSLFLVRGNLYDVFVYIVLWAVLFILGLFVCFVIPFVLLTQFLPDSGVLIADAILDFNLDISRVFFQLSFLPPMVYMFAYLTDKKLHAN